MAKLIPDIDKIKLFDRKPTESEYFLLDKLKEILDDTHEIFYQPFYNGDRPTIIIVKKNYYIYILEICNININEYDFTEDQFVCKHDKDITYDPFNQLLTYKNNIYNLHLYSFDKAKREDSKAFGIISCGFYFHKISQSELNNIKTKIKNNNISKYLKIFNQNMIDDEIKYLKYKSQNKYFHNVLYDDIIRLLNPPDHIAELGINITYDKKQSEIFNYNKRNEFVVKGGMGTGKTTVLAICAVTANKQTNEPVLILTYNIALRNLIHEKINEIKEDFVWNNFYIIHYHEFIKTELNNLGIRIHPTKANSSSREIDNDLEENYYSKEDLFEKYKDKIYKYSTILIDEIQDYKKSWLNIIKKYFLKQNGKFIIFGDINQNIYKRDTISNKSFETNIIGRPLVLNECYRSDSKIIELANLFKKEIYHENDNEDILFMAGKENKIVYKQNNIGYFISDERIEEISMLKVDIPMIYNKIRTYIKKESYHPNDIAIISNKLNIIRELEFYYQYSCREKTNISFERFEECISSKTYYEIWNIFPQHLFNDLFKEKFENVKYIILLCYLHKKYNTFNVQLEDYCINNIDYHELISFIDRNELLSSIELDMFLHENIGIRRFRKLNFVVNKGTIKFSTIHTFKGWQSKCVFLLLDTSDIDVEDNMLELIYTGLTRAKNDLLVFNIGNDETNIKLSELIHNFNQLVN